MRQDRRLANSAVQSLNLKRLKIDIDTWLDIATTFKDSYSA